jgi:hypothetical protein
VVEETGWGAGRAAGSVCMGVHLESLCQMQKTQATKLLTERLPCCVAHTVASGAFGCDYNCAQHLCDPTPVC